MNDTTTIMSDWSEDEQAFTAVIIKIIESRQRKYEREHKELDASPVPLGNIKICPKDFENYIPIMQGIDLHRDWKVTAQYMLRLLWDKDELVSYARDTYTLTKEGRLYKILDRELASTP